ncbi:hypothetical protein [Fructobacillus cardui]|uniref:hypothetical protein n=1 Tax=Fructobacillus cardui TaxID=2893170 RepID=UPI00259A4198|nr:hypothetical protein [uncultured Fructobacillus sp.]
MAGWPDPLFSVNHACKSAIYKSDNETLKGRPVSVGALGRASFLVALVKLIF